MKQRHILLSFALLSTWACVANARCDRTPSNVVSEKSHGDGDFYLAIEGNPQTYIPEETYKVYLKSYTNSFIDFLVSVNNDGSGGTDAGIMDVNDKSLTRFSKSCHNTITAKGAISKHAVTMRWTAPPSGNGCVALQAMVLEKHDVWYQDDGSLTKSLCEDTSDATNIAPLLECCAPNEAKYEVSFRGLWSRNTHPKQFPDNEWDTQYSDLVGASHSYDYRFWDQREYASQGLRDLAEFGSTKVLENELLQKVGPEDRQVRTIIKAKGQRYPNRNDETFAIFRVDSVYHLVSLVSSIQPSPDWFLGVSGVELCLSNCSWAYETTLKLYPWDAGTDNGITYKSHNDQAFPALPIRRLSVNSPNDPNSPFYDPQAKEMEPFAILTFTRLREYEVKTSIDDGNSGVGEEPSPGINTESERRTSGPPEENEEYDRIEESPGDSGVNQCPRMSPWVESVECNPVSGTCGEGVVYLSRYIMNNQPKDAPPLKNGACDVSLLKGIECNVKCVKASDNNQTIHSLRYSGPIPHVGLTGDGSLTGVDGPPKTNYFNGNYGDRRWRKHVRVQSNEPYKENNPFNGMHAEALVLSSDKNQVQASMSLTSSIDCKVSRWSEWSKCQGDCGFGEKIRFRNIIRKDQNGGKPCPKKIKKYRRCALPPCSKK